MQTLETFFWGFTGSAAVEVLTLLSFYYVRPIQLPARYRKVGFWITRFLLAVLAGGIPVGYQVHDGMLAFNIGAATPLIIGFMARGLRPGSTAAEILVPMSRKSEEEPADSEDRADRTHSGVHAHGPRSGRR